MKKILSAIIIVGLALTFFLWYRKTSEHKPLSDVLIVGTSSDFPPFSFRAADDSISGFDIDVVKEVAKRLNMDIDLQDKPFGTLLPQMEVGQIHIIAAGITPTEERAKRVRFTKPYLSSNPLLIVTRASDPEVTGLEDLKGKEVIVNTGYSAAIYLSTMPEITLLRLPRVPDALTALEQGKGDAFVTASFTVKPFVKDGDTRFNFYRLTETDEQTALALSKNLPEEFAQKVQSILDDMEADGTLDALKKKWNVI